MGTSTTTVATAVSATSLRTRWNRGFTLLTAIVVLSALAGLIGSRLMVQTFHSSALRVEHETTINAQLRSDVVDHAVVLAGEVDPAQQRRVAELQSAIRTGYREASAIESHPESQALVAESLAKWDALVAAAGPPGQPVAQDVRGTAVATLAPQVLNLLDEAGSTSRAAVRTELADAAQLDRIAVAILAVLELLAVVLVVRLARRLSVEVLRPVAVLRDSANHLAAGRLDHRVAADRADELGDLAASFNAMADAIAGSQRTLTREANTDSLSGLANRAAFHARLEASLVLPNRRSSSQAVLFVDLDDFKDVNDTLGHAAGDELLRVTARRLSAAARPGDLVARLGGDEFALLLDDVADIQPAIAVAERVVRALAEVAQLGEHRARVGASVGVAMRRDSSTVETLMHEADVAMYAAKAKGKNRVESFDACLDSLDVARHSLRGDLGSAADRGELVLEYQPVVDLDTGDLVGLEALVRWQHHTRGLLPPSAFIELAEETGDIVGIGAWVLETAAWQLKQWQRRYWLPELWMSVNVSVRQLDTPGFADQVKDVLQTTKLDPTRLVLEVTESMFADPKGGAAAALAALRLPGVRVALDDFGTGYSSIGYLRQLPVDVLKIDRSFVSGTAVGDSDDALLDAIVAMAHRLGLDVIPEGIEDLDQLSRLRAMGCHIGQGFLLSRPLSAQAVEVLLASPMPFPEIGLREQAPEHQ